MSKKPVVDLAKSSLPRSPSKRVEVLAKIVESPTTRKGLANRGVISSAEKNEEIDVALAALRDVKDSMACTKRKRSNDSRAATQTAVGFLCGEEINKRRMKSKVSRLLGINRKRVTNAFKHRQKILRSEQSCWTYTERRRRSDAIPTEHRKRFG